MAVKTKKVKLDDDVRDVLERSAIDGWTLRLPEGNLERSLYVKVDKAIKAAGGKWNKSAKGHVFESDPSETLGIVIASGEVVDQKQTYQEFFTPPELAKEIVRRAGVCEGQRVLEPSAGIGSIAIAASKAGGKVVCFELQEKNGVILRDLGYSTIIDDFLKWSPSLFQPFDAVVMNPPFTGGQDIEHVRHAIKFLGFKGRLVSVVSHSVLFREDAKYVAFRELIDSNEGTIDELPDDSFKVSGTAVKTALVVV